jgi:glycosyltransferase involved in cell wall biosynthesis
MVICHVWDADYPWDVRVEKISTSLSKKHEVHLVCRNSARRVRHERINGFTIHRLPALPMLFGRVQRFVGFPAFFNPVWIYMIWQTVRTVRADLILVRDLPLALTALLVGRVLRKPVVLDMAENYPAMIQDVWDSQEFSAVNMVVRNPSAVRFVERLCVRWTDHILAVVEESRDRLIAMGVSRDKISLVINTPTSSRWHRSAERHPLIHVRQSGQLVLVYLGLLERARGLETAIRAVDRVRTQGMNVRLVIVGSGIHEHDFRRLASELQLQEHVIFTGWLNYDQAIALINESDVGIVPHHATESWNSTIPNKLFDYMSMSKPVVVSDAKPTARIVKEEHCGIVVKDRNAEDFALAILRLADDSVRAEMGRRGREAVARRYNWDVDEKRLFDAIEFASGRSESPSSCVA